MTRDKRVLLGGVCIDVIPGEVHAVLGPNGAGKSTLLRLLAGDIEPDEGGVTLDSRPLPAWPLHQLAQRRAVLPQHDSLRFGFTARQVVALGRLPFAGAGSADDTRIVHEALTATGVEVLANRRYPTLSGGERARVQLARVLAQLWPDARDPSPRYLLLDEPTASLDLAHQYECLKQMRRFAANGGGVLAVLHDPNQALIFSHRVTLLSGGRVFASGRAADVLTADRLSELYGLPLEIHTSLNGYPVIGVAHGQTLADSSSGPGALDQ